MNAHPEIVATRRGFVLVAVLVVIVMLSLSAYAFAVSMRIEAKAAETHLRATQARLAAESGVELARALLLLQRQGFNMPDLNDNAELFRDVALFDDAEDVHPRLRARFSVVATTNLPGAPPGATAVRFGVADENAKLDLNAWADRDPGQLKAALETSLRLPADLAGRIAGRVRELGRAAHTRTMPSLSAEGTAVPSVTRDPYERIDDLLQVNGVSRALLYGEDTMAAGAPEVLVPLSPRLAMPLADAVTLYARSAEIDRFGRPRIYLNDPDLPALFEHLKGEFGEPLARFVIAARVFGSAGMVTAPQGTNPTPPGGAYHFTSVTQLVGGSASGTWQGKPVSIGSPVDNDASRLREDLPRLLDRLTVAAAPIRTGTININTALDAVLAMLPGLTAQQRSAITGRRLTASFLGRDASTHTGLAWLVTEGIVSLEEFRAIEPFVTGRSEVLRVRALGYFGSRGPWVEIEAVVDGTRHPPELLFSEEHSGMPPGELRQAINLAARPHVLPDLSRKLIDDLSNQTPQGSAR